MSSLRLTRELPNCKVGVGVLRPLVEKHSILWIWYNIEHSSKNLHIIHRVSCVSKIRWLQNFKFVKHTFHPHGARSVDNLSNKNRNFCCVNQQKLKPSFINKLKSNTIEF